MNLFSGSSVARYIRNIVGHCCSYKPYFVRSVHQNCIPYILKHELVIGQYYALINQLLGPYGKIFGPQFWRTDRVKWDPYKTMKSECFPQGTSDWLIRALLDGHRDLVEKFSESCRKFVGKFMNYHSKLIFVRMKQKHHRKNCTSFRKISGEFSVNFRQVVDDSHLINARQFSFHTSPKSIFENTLTFKSYWFEVQYALSRSNTALDGPQINQLNCEFVSSYTIREEAKKKDFCLGPNFWW